MTQEFISHRQRRDLLSEAKLRFGSDLTLQQVQQKYQDRSREDLSPEARCINANKSTCFRDLGKKHYGSHLKVSEASQFVHDEIEQFRF